MHGLQFSAVLSDFWRSVTKPRLLVYAALFLLVPQLTYFFLSSYTLQIVSSATSRYPNVSLSARHSYSKVNISVLGLKGSVVPNSTLSLGVFKSSAGPLDRLRDGDKVTLDLNDRPAIVACVAGLIVLSIIAKLLYYAFASFLLVAVFGWIRAELWRDQDLWRLTIRHNMWYYLVYSMSATILLVILAVPLRESVSAFGLGSIWILLPFLILAVVLELRLSIWASVLVIEEAGLVGSVKRSFELTRGNSVMILILAIVVLFLPTLLEIGGILIDPSNEVSADPDSFLTTLGLGVRDPMEANPILVALQLLDAFLIPYFSIALNAVIYTQLRTAQEAHSEPAPLTDADRVVLANFAGRQ